MKKFLKFAVAICLMFTVVNMEAQVKFGPKVGLNLSTMTLKALGISVDPKTLAGFHLGVISEITLTNSLTLQPGILYSTKGSKYKIDTEEFSMAPSFLEIPVNVLYGFDLGGAKLDLFAGPYFAYGIGGKSKSGGESADIKFGSGQENDMKPFDLGINIGAGINLSNIIISAQYGLGLTNLSPVTDNDAEMKTKVIGISIAYLFGGK
jgi:hypothetical protein